MYDLKMLGVSTKTGVINPDGKTQVVHVMRDPVDMIISGYLYHKSGAGTEGWADQEWKWCVGLRVPFDFPTGGPRMPKGRMINCTRLDGTFISYRELLRVLPPEEGILVEATHSYHQDIKDMVVVYKAMRDDSSSVGLGLCLEDFASDFVGTSRKFYTHIGVPRDSAELECLLSLIKAENPRKPHVGHATSDVPDDEKWKLEQILRGHQPTWTRLTQIRAALDGSCV
jgi:hypothetical protein